MFGVVLISLTCITDIICPSFQEFSGLRVKFHVSMHLSLNLCCLLDRPLQLQLSMLMLDCIRKYGASGIKWLVDNITMIDQYLPITIVRYV